VAYLAPRGTTGLGPRVGELRLPSLAREQKVVLGDGATLPRTTAAGSYRLFVCVTDDGVAHDRSHCITARTVLRVAVPATPVPPRATADEYTAIAGVPLAVATNGGVLVNDARSRRGLRAQVVTSTAHGSLSLRPDGSFVYVPAAGFTGIDGFTYRVRSPQGTSRPVAVTVRVVAATATPAPATPAPAPAPVVTTPVVTPPVVPTPDPTPAPDPVPDPGPTNAAPVAVDDTYLAFPGQTLETASGKGVLANDTDADGDPLTAILVSGPSHGTLTLDADGAFVYQPTPGYFGPDSFTYRASDGKTISNVATVSISVSTPR
jgi:hypothetical protein